MTALRRFVALLILLWFSPALAQPQVGGWLYAGSDVPPDPAWQLGVLPNGLRYAVRRNATPAGSVSVRLRMDVGGLMERAEERGYAHFIEHMVFRGSAGVPDGEGVRIWQRLGAGFGADTNAFTSATQTFYSLDLPRNDRVSLDTAVATLAGMMRAATFDPKLVDVERKVVLAERDLRVPPLARRIQDASKELFFAGLAARNMDVAGTPETLAAADAGKLRAFYDRWYRPERATLVIVGDADPAVLRALVERYFADWRGRGPAGIEPEYGQPVTPPTSAALVTDPLASSSLLLVWPKPHDDRPITRARNAEQITRTVAARILARRLTLAARGGAPFTSAAAYAVEGRHVMDQTAIAATPRQTQWPEAMANIFSILAGGVAALPSQTEIAREVLEIEDALQAQTVAQATVRSSALAEALLSAVDAGSVVAAPDTLLALFEELKPRLTPATVGAALRGLTVGEARALLTSPRVVSGGQAAVAEVLALSKSAKAAARIEAKAVSFADLGRPAQPGRVVSRSMIADLGLTRVRFANGVELIVKPAEFEKDRVLVSVAVGNGLAGLPADVAVPTWSSGALTQGGVGPFDVDAVERLTAGRRITLGFGTDERSFDFTSATNGRDLTDQLRLIAAAIAEPRFDAGALGRLTAALAGSYDGIFGAPGGVYNALSARALHGGDMRWRYPEKSEIAGFRVDAFRNFWSPILATGPRRVIVVGDVDVEKAIQAVATTIGAAVTKPLDPPTSAQLAVTAPRRPQPDLRLGHRGDPDQALVALAWPTEGALADTAGVRALNVAATIVQFRLFDRFREAEGGTYSPSVYSRSSQSFPDYGLFVAVAQVPAARIGDFERATREIIADLARTAPSADEVARATAPIVSANERNLRTGAFWLNALERDLDDPRVLDQIRTVASGYRGIDAGTVQAAARKWLRRAPTQTILVEADKPGTSAAGAN